MPMSNALSERERQVLALVALGHTNREVGVALFLSENTIRTHLKRIMMKTGTRNRIEAVLAWQGRLG